MSKTTTTTQLPDVLQFFASFLPGVAEQVIEVPKIFPDTIPQRLGDHLRQPQMVEQLVHVPTVVSYSLLQQRTAVQFVDFPVPGRAEGWGRGGLHGPPGQGSTALCEADFVDTPVPFGLREESGGLQSFLPVQDSTAFCGADYVEQIVDIPVRGGLQGFPPGQASSSSRSRLVDEAEEWGFLRTFPPGKKCGVPGRWVRSWVGTSAHPR